MMTRYAVPLAEIRPAPVRSTAAATFLLEMRPLWWDRAACRGSGPAEWQIERHGNTPAKVSRLRMICAACPASGECLEAAMLEPLPERIVGPLRVGVSGRGWRLVHRIVAEYAPVTPADWSTLAAFLLDEPDELFATLEPESTAVAS